jgi:hypothetical protein
MLVHRQQQLGPLLIRQRLLVVRVFARLGQTLQPRQQALCGVGGNERVVIDWNAVIELALIRRKLVPGRRVWTARFRKLKRGGNQR